MLSPPSLTATKPLESALALLESVYGKVESSDFPRPMPKDEAGLCADGHQRRYLWTDAFGVLAYTSIAQDYSQKNNPQQAQLHQQAAQRLIQVVHECLGTPRSPQDIMRVDPDSPFGFVGLRIGKVETRKVTDYGMQFDGQYWHYIDKWLLALARAGRADDGIRIAKSVFPYFMDAGPLGTGFGGGIRWKLSVDATPPPALQRAHASDDTLMALIVFSLLQQYSSSGASLEQEIQMLRNSLQHYRLRVTDDPLGWGLEAICDQYLENQPRQAALAALQASALHPSHLSLPFRLYGAILGARIGGAVVASPQRVDELIVKSLKHEKEAMARGSEEHSSINRYVVISSRNIALRKYQK